jgi:two-component sensor histidine kinase
MDLSDWLFNPSGLTPHGFCLLWVPGLIYLHAISDAVIGVAYFSIPLALAAFAARRKDLQYTWVIQLFVAFILACGTTHFMSILTLWVPVYGIEGLIKGITAVLSIATAALLWPLLPKLLAIPSPRQLSDVNAELSRKILEHEDTLALLRASEVEVKRANSELEKRVGERTAELSATNEKLVATLAQRDLLLREVYHRVKNNLQVVDSIVALQVRKLEDADAIAAMASLRSRIHALGLVHQQLMGSSDLETFDIAPFLRELSANLLSASGKEGVTIEVSARAHLVNLDFAISVGLIVTELVTNSLKHAFGTSGGQITVFLDDRADGDIALVVADNGQAGPEPAPANKGLGTSILQGFVSQLKAKMTVTRNKGTRTEIAIPSGVIA